MISSKRRIRNLDRHFGYLPEGKNIAFGVRDVNRIGAKLEAAGFVGLNAGDSTLPSRVGPVSRYNAEGRQLVRRDLPMETAYRQIEWSWTERHGSHEVEQTGIKDVPYRRYPRDTIAPPSVELSLAHTVNGQMAVVSPYMKKCQANEKALIHTVNLILELFHECEAFGEDMAEIIRVPNTRLNWRILPSGRRPWERLEQELMPALAGAPRMKRSLALYRFQAINAHAPTFVATGHAGFSGYVVFGFPSINLFVCESVFTGNATYVFGQDWETLSCMTKAELLTAGLVEHRIIHRSGWIDQINGMLSH